MSKHFLQLEQELYHQQVYKVKNAVICKIKEKLILILILKFFKVVKFKIENKKKMFVK